jgi:prevent-host-death family protein
MTATYSTYQAKTQFSDVLRKVRGGETVLISYHGRTVAEIRPVREDESFEQRLERMKAQGLIVGPTNPEGPEPHGVAHRPGALKRFLDSRD